jgi:enoyl-CoA hydratase/carnithine racemase
MALVEFEVKERLAIITLNRPEKMNAINAAMRAEYATALTRVRDSDDIWAVIVTGRGKAFSAGHDLSESLDVPGSPSIPDLYALQRSVMKPVITAINGFCLAQGCGIALNSDIRIASQEARFGWPQVKRGISSVSGPSMLAKVVPLNIALEFLLTGDFIDAERALQLHLVNYVVPPQEVMPKALAIARTILENAPLAVRAMKEAALRTLHMRDDDAYAFTDMLLRRIEETEDAKEGLAAFAEKRKPVWKAR